MPRFQTINDPKPDRTDHVWMLKDNADVFKCVLCGAVAKYPPDRLPANPKKRERLQWLPEQFEPLTDEERELGRSKQNDSQ